MSYYVQMDWKLRGNDTYIRKKYQHVNERKSEKAKWNIPQVHK